MLTAGRGARLRPLTDTIPKPLLPIAGEPIAAHTLSCLARVGCEATAMNLHHLGDQVRQRFGSSCEGMALEYSEETELLGTLGALYPLRDFLAEAEAVVVINGDSYCPWPLKWMIRKHLASGAAATLLLATGPNADRYGGGVAIDRQGRILGFRGAGAERGEVARRHVFAGAQILSPRVLRHVPEGPGDTVGDLYMPMVERGSFLLGLPTRRRWHDLGTPRRYLNGVLDFARGRWPGRLLRRSWVSPRAAAERGSRLRGVCLEADSAAERGAVLERVLLLPGAKVPSGSHLRDTIVGPQAVLPANSRLEGRLVTLAREGVPPAAGDSRVGDLLYTPFDPAS